MRREWLNLNRQSCLDKRQFTYPTTNLT
jgi:hypothetical protein